MTARPLVLVADDDADIRRLVERRLVQSGIGVVSAADGDEALAAALSEQPDLLLLDVSMPGLDGYGVCAALAAANTCPPPVIFLTAHGHVDARVKGLEAGAVDYVTKPFDGPELVARVRAALRTKAERDRLAYDARTDALTGLPNRRELDIRLEQAVASATRYGRPLACALLDIDDFKRINDAYGHPTGDAVLAEVGSRLRRAARTSDFVARYGGEEFAVILEVASANSAVSAAERLREAVSERPIVVDVDAFDVRISIGVALHEAGMRLPELLAAADEALYEAKSRGKNRVEFHPLAA